MFYDRIRKRWPVNTGWLFNRGDRLGRFDCTWGKVENLTGGVLNPAWQHYNIINILIVIGAYDFNCHKHFTFISLCAKLLGWLEINLAGMVIRWKFTMTARSNSALTATIY